MSDQTIELVLERSPAPISVRLSVISGPHQGYEILLSQSCVITVGRGEQAIFRLANEMHLSRVHARLEVERDRVTVTDLNSTNGTSLNGAPVKEAVIRDVGVLIFGSSKVQVAVERQIVVEQPTQCLTNENSLNQESANDILLATALYSGSQDRGDLDFSCEARDDSNELTPGAMFETPRTFGDYEIEEPIGKGGMATVFKALHVPSQEWVAIKFIREELQGTGKLRKLFSREAAILSHLNHPCIVRARHFGLDDDRMYLVMDYIPSVNILEWMNTKTVDERIRVGCWIVMRVLEALHFAHERGIVHRDVKPSNILTFRDGKHLKARLSDFGLAKFYEDAGVGGITEERSIRGTLGFMPPEQIRESKSVGPSADIYSAAACLYCFTTSKFPNPSFTATTPFDLKALEILPPRLSQILKKALELEPERRFKSAAQFAKLLEPFCLRQKKV